MWRKTGNSFQNFSHTGNISQKPTTKHKRMVKYLSATMSVIYIYYIYIYITYVLLGKRGSDVLLRIEDKTELFVHHLLCTSKVQAIGSKKTSNLLELCCHYLFLENYRVQNMGEYVYCNVSADF